MNRRDPSAARRSSTWFMIHSFAGLLPRSSAYEASRFVAPPSRGSPKRSRVNTPPSTQRPRRVNYLEIEARNASLGAAGEAFVLEVEHQRLWESGAGRLANRIEHVSQTRGDGMGYDVLSFEDSGRERLIEVKTTNFGSMTPFFASAHEVSFSEESAETFFICIGCSITGSLRAYSPCSVLSVTYASWIHSASARECSKVPLPHLPHLRQARLTKSSRTRNVEQIAPLGRHSPGGSHRLSLSRSLTRYRQKVQLCRSPAHQPRG